MNKTFQTMVKFYEKRNFEFMITKPGESIGIKLEMKNSSYYCISMIEDCTFSLISHFPIKVPVDKYSSMCEFIALNNYGLKHCQFQIDLRNGQIECVTRNFLGKRNFLEKNSFNDSIIEELLSHNISAMDTIFPLFMKLLFTDMSVEEVIEWSLNR